VVATENGENQQRGNGGSTAGVIQARTYFRRITGFKCELNFLDIWMHKNKENNKLSFGATSRIINCCS
jgi:hypothetical protein